MPCKGTARSDRTLPMLISAPPPAASRCGMATSEPFTSPQKLVSNSRRMSASLTSSSTPQMPTPALFTQVSMRPNRSTASRDAVEVITDGHVCDDGEGLASRRGDPRDRPVEGGARPRGEDYPRPLGRRHARGREPEAAGGAGHDHHLVGDGFEVPYHGLRPGASSAGTASVA